MGASAGSVCSYANRLGAAARAMPGHSKRQTLRVQTGAGGRAVECGEERCKSPTALGVVGLLLPKLLPTSATVSNAGKVEAECEACGQEKVAGNGAHAAEGRWRRAWMEFASGCS